MYSAEPLPHFVDEYLSYLYEVHPTNATFDGVHLHDDLLEDLSRQSIDAQMRDLGGLARRLAAIDPTRLTDVERLERPALDASLRARLFELEEVRTWERSPQLYADILSTSLAGQAVFDYAPLAERARRVLSKLRQVPRLIQAARDNIKDPPGIYVKVGLESMRGTLRFIDEDLPRAFGDLGDLHLLGDLADASTEAATAIGAYVEYLERDLAPRSKGSFRLGRDRFEQKLRLDEGITLNADRLLAIAMRELRATQEEFRRVASRMNGGDPLAAWAKVKDDHPPAGQLVPVAQQQLDELVDFLNRQRIVTVPEGAAVAVAPTPRFYRWTFASMWTPGPFESRPLRAYYYITDVDPAWAADRKAEHLRDFNYGALWSISIHEVFPGHFLHYQHLRQVGSKLRKSILFSSTAFVEGWAHYCEQMMIEQGFRRDDDNVRLGQLAEALIRLCRFVVGIRLHCEDCSVEQGVRFFREEAFLEEPSARREAERGTFDPSYILYTAGKLMVLKLREDYKARQEGRFSLRAFHDQLLANGTVPMWLHRALMLGEQNGEMIE
ncbi:MAG: hypothetical protein A3H96_25405 [Acidobacteria bacterium RIFCSPLOWO2_02_FULL_67_36]|nr:MAG: hypothetical protein A3H96_25405 [Acidobacteria bacterium RIFCSPLOWO2_02_FULL_67_36]OFW22897.1 MAG: hypothetical protein A3G21_01140 [Acidobacteria bacterium RIFCSPLOWO2_12_FULL_66_21]